jgi:2-polyprenyl-3-methyl-5-hydroxy-6-metoxy-1,4-benzoquinol methylase
VAPHRALFSWFKRRILRDQRERWDHQYASGRWEKLKDASEQARFVACANLLRRHAPGGNVLEIGSGEALLQRHLKPEEYASWLGIDLSEVAVARAQAFAGARGRYVAADMTTFEPEGKFHSIVFPESIYYVPERAALLQRYARHLLPGGVFIVSIFETKRSAAVWEEIHAATAVIDSLATTNELGTWQCEVLRLR